MKDKKKFRLNGLKSKTSKINITRERLLDLFKSYSLCAQDWEPAKEEDWNDVVEGVNEILEEFYEE